MGSRIIIQLVAVFILLISSSFPVQSQIGEVQSPEILVAWEGEDVHVYHVLFDDSASYEVDVNISIESNLEVEYPEFSTQWVQLQQKSCLIVDVDASLSWFDHVSIIVDVQTRNGAPLVSEVQATREFDVGIWNQPLDDHEITLKTTWSMQQNYSDEFGPQVFDLEFDGQGWQQRTGDILDSWELGSGTLYSIENSETDSTILDLEFSSIWKNETTLNGTMTSQVFEANGDGQIVFITNESGMVTEVEANVTSAYLNRSTYGNEIDEYLRLEAVGTLAVSEIDDESELDIQGEISVFVLEYKDESGQRVMQHSQIEAIADFLLLDEGTRLDADLNKFIAIERWENGARVLHLEEIQGDGTFGLQDEEDNSSIMVNGTIFDIHQKVVNGTTQIDDLHVDGIITGDVQGTFGILRTIESQGNESNATGEFFLVNIIHQETWFNLTGIGGGSWFGGSELGSVYNNTYDYQSVYSDWENRTVRLKWEETGPDPSSGDERPERSPIFQEPDEPEPAEGLGNLSISRETGLVPIPLVEGDSFLLDGQESAVLQVTTEAIHQETWDAHVVYVIDWTGVYGNNSSPNGTAHGSIIVEGPLNGLLVNTTRQINLLSEIDGENLFTETQELDKILSPSIVGSDDNTPPIIGNITIRQGLLIGEGGSIGHLEIEVQDLTWNLREVTADLSAIGLGLVELNDRGLNGDDKIGDEVYTTDVLVSGLEVGEIEIQIFAKDAFDVQATKTATILVENRAPRIIDIEIMPSSLQRGQSVVINLEASDGHGVTNVSLDLREYGGEVYNMSEENGIWSTMVEMPFAMTPGAQTLTFNVIDGMGGQSIASYWYSSESTTEPIIVTIQNEPPIVDAPGLTIKKNSGTDQLLSLSVFDPDGISTVKVELGVFTELGGSELTTMYDDGSQGGDLIAGDGFYSAVLSIRDATPIGTFELIIYTTDVYGATSTTSVTVVLEQDTIDNTASGNDGLLLVFGGVVLLAALVVGFMLKGGGKNDGANQDRFGNH